jgi:hypothetical protein
VIILMRCVKGLNELLLVLLESDGLLDEGFVLLLELLDDGLGLGEHLLGLL